MSDHSGHHRFEADEFEKNEYNTDKFETDAATLPETANESQTAEPDTNPEAAETKPLAVADETADQTEARETEPEQDGGEKAESRESAGEDEELSDEELNRFIEELCLSKAEEFHLLGYEHVTGKEIWECVSESYAKEGVPLLHQIVNDILSLKVTRFMNWMTLQAYKRDDLYKELNA